MKKLLIKTIALSSLIFTGTSFSYHYTTCDGDKTTWDDGWTNMYISTTSFPEGGAHDSRLQNAMWHWNNVKKSKWKFYVKRDTDGSHNSDNDRNEIYWDADMSLDGTLAVTHMRTTCYWLFGTHTWIDEADIGFNQKYSWSTGSYSYSNPNGAPYSFESTALHELGHVLGLNHENDVMATLNSHYPNSGPFGNSKEWDSYADDCQGVRYLYPESSTDIDIACSVLKRTGSGSSGLTSSPTTAAKGSSVTIEYTFSNLGTSRIDFNIGYYLSTDATISTGDTRLATNTGAYAGAGSTGTYTKTLTIPSSTATGTYYLGLIVDYNNAVTESNESNNACPMPRTIYIN